MLHSIMPRITLNAQLLGHFIRKCVEILKATANLKIHNEWHHACFSLKKEELDSEIIKITSKTYYDGTLLTGGMQ